LQEVSEAGSQVRVRYLDPSGAAREMFVDHVIGGTGFQPFLKSLKFLDEKLAEKVRTASGVTDVDSHFESSVPGLFLTGLASAYNFGPMCRFACGARFTAGRLSQYLRRTDRQKSVAVTEPAELQKQPEHALPGAEEVAEVVMQNSRIG